MKRTKIFFLLLLTAMSVAAQNAVDEAVEQFSTVGTAKFTSAIERDPRTRDIVKVVKTLRVEAPNAASLRNTFLKEARRHDAYETAEAGRRTCVFTDEVHNTARVYMLDYNGSRAEVTIIVNYRAAKTAK